MADITKCANGCDKKHSCYRFTAPDSMMQSYSDFKKDDSGKCLFFYDNATRTGFPKGTRHP